VLKGRNIDNEHPAAQPPNPGAGMARAASRELDSEMYGRLLAERNSDHSSEATI
jgi:hypothetical protein